MSVCAVCPSTSFKTQPCCRPRPSGEAWLCAVKAYLPPSCGPATAQVSARWGGCDPCLLDVIYTKSSLFFFHTDVACKAVMGRHLSNPS